MQGAQHVSIMNSDVSPLFVANLLSDRKNKYFWMSFFTVFDQKLRLLVNTYQRNVMMGPNINTFWGM